MNKETIILIIAIPLISAFIGWLTNYIAIKSLFRPIKKIKFFGISFQGLIPKRKKALAKNISEVIEEYLFSNNDILKELNKPSNVKKIKKKLLPILENKILEKVPGMFRMIAEPIISKVLETEIDDLITKIGEELGNHIFENINIKEIASNKINEYDTKDMEKIIYKIASSELKHIEYLGAIIGFIVGLSQLGIMLILN